jgi:hypothetical protein
VVVKAVSQRKPAAGIAGSSRPHKPASGVQLPGPLPTLPAEAVVAEKLAASMVEHQQAKQEVQGVAGRRKIMKPRIKALLMRAALLRKEAHALDPEHKAPAWAEEQRHTARGVDTHAMMMAFYRDQGFNG